MLTVCSEARLLSLSWLWHLALCVSTVNQQEGGGGEGVIPLQKNPSALCLQLCLSGVMTVGAASDSEKRLLAIL